VKRQKKMSLVLIPFRSDAAPKTSGGWGKEKEGGSGVKLFRRLVVDSTEKAEHTDLKPEKIGE